MSETSETSEAPRFTRSRGATLLKAPLPERLAATLPARERKQHGRLVERCELAGREVARLKNAIAEAPERDRRATSDAALAGEELPESSEPGLRGEMEQALRTRSALEDALRRSADLLLASAAGKAEEVAAELDRELDGLAADVRARLADLGEALGELGSLTAQAGWTRGLVHATGQVSAFHAGHTGLFRDTLGDVSRVREAFEHELGQIEQRKRDADEERAQMAAWRQAAELERQDAAERERRAAQGEEAPAG